MVTRLRPLDVKLVFEDHPYKLGETIDLRVELDAKGAVEVREGRVDLVCEVRWGETFTVMVPTFSRPSRSAVAGVGGVYIPPKVPKQVTKEYRETYVHSSVVFIEDERLDSGGTSRYNAMLEIQPEPPGHVEKGTVKWSLVTAIDVAQARDIKTRCPVKVTVERRSL